MSQAKVVGSTQAALVAVARALWLGLVLWGVLFSWSSALYPWAVANRLMFESLRGVVLASAATTVGTAYLRGLSGRILGRALAASALWTLTCVSLDLVVSMLQPPRFAFSEYLASGGLGYLMIPVIVLGLAYQRLRVQRPDPL
jgi:hypothetical protein